MLDKVYKEVKKQCDILYNVLVANGVTPKDKKLSTLVECAKKLYCIHPRKHYGGVILDEFGYVEKLFKLDNVVEYNPNSPYLTKGFYKVKDNKLIIDEERKLELYPDKVTF